MSREVIFKYRGPETKCRANRTSGIGDSPRFYAWCRTEDARQEEHSLPPRAPPPWPNEFFKVHAPQSSPEGIPRDRHFPYESSLNWISWSLSKMARKAVTFSQEACNYFILVLRYEKVFSEVEDDQRRIPGIDRGFDGWWLRFCEF